MASQGDICNMAIGHLGVQTTIENLETEKSAEARICRTFFDTVRDDLLREANWPFAKHIAAGQLIATQPNTVWRFAYRYPVDCINMRRIVVPSGVYTNSPIPYEMGQDSGGELILTNEETAFFEYTRRVEEAERYPADFVMAFTYKLAGAIAPALTSGDPFKLRDAAEQRYLRMISKAKAQAKNEEQVGPAPASEFERAR